MLSSAPSAPVPASTTDAAQRAIAELPVDASAVVLGAPGTGKTTALLARVRALIDAGVRVDEVLVLTPSRRTATVLRDRLALAVDVASDGALARSMTSFAFQIVRAAEVRAAGEPPHLLAAGDQDRIIADLLAADIDDPEHASIAWPTAIGPQVRASREFRTELRTLIAECTESGVDAGALRELAARRGSAAWGAAASFLTQYRRTLAAMRASARDASDLLREAGVLLERSPRGAEGERVLGAPGRLRAVLVDDAQELTRGGVDIVRGLRERGVAVMAFGDPDIASGSFRGASPAEFSRLCDLLGAVHVLDAPHRAAPGLVRLTRVVTAAIGAAGRVDHRRAPAPRDDTDPSVRAMLAASPFEEVDAIARAVREWHLLDEIPWSRIAVIAHDTRQVADLEAELAAREVPTRAAGVQRPLGREQVVRDLVEIVRLGMTDPDLRDPDAITAALLSPFGGLDAVGLRRLRARLRHAELADGGSRPARELLASGFVHPLELSLLDTPEARSAERLATTLAQLHAEAARGATAHELLWIAWERARDGAGRPVARVWHELAVGGGVLAAEAGHALDALVALFDAAKRYVERDDAEGAAPFLRRILDSDVPEDVLASPESDGTLTVLTPATALGTEFDAVVIAGVQDGVWPNLRLRGGLLDTWRLADEAAAWRAGDAAPPPPATIDRRRSVLHDELRLFARAVSRARSRVLVTAVDDDDRGPSTLFSFLPEPEHPDPDPLEGGHPLTLRGLVSQHRRTLTSSTSEPALDHAAGQLVLLALAGVPGAATAEWFGVTPPSSTAPLYDPARAPVPVSPSALSSLSECAVDWVVKSLGGSTTTWSKGAGVILHAAMEDVPGGDLDELRRIVDDRWAELDFEAPWMSVKEKAWAYLLTERLHRYLTSFADAGGRAVGAEERFRLAVERVEADAGPPPVRALDGAEGTAVGSFAVLNGSIDRVELFPQPDGSERAVIVDLKTGRSEKRVIDKHVADDPQLAAYQLALTEGLVPGAQGAENGGARLIVLSQTTAKEPHFRLPQQPPLSPEQRSAFLQSIVRTAELMAATSFEAPIDAHCATARFGVCSVHTVRAVSAS